MNILLRKVEKSKVLPKRQTYRIGKWALLMGDLNKIMKKGEIRRMKFDRNKTNIFELRKYITILKLNIVLFERTIDNIHYLYIQKR